MHGSVSLSDITQYKYLAYFYRKKHAIPQRTQPVASERKTNVVLAGRRLPVLLCGRERRRLRKT